MESADAPAAIGPYSQAVETSGFLFTAGQIGLEPESGEFAGPDVERQARRALANLRAVIEEAGASLGDVVKTTIFLADMDEYGEVNEIYGEYFSEPYPARSVIEAARLPKDARIEIEAVARTAIPRR